MNIQGLVDYAKQLPVISVGLSEPYSPNHTSGLTTTQHVHRQLEMLLCLQNADYKRIADFVRNEKVAPDKRVGTRDLEDLLGPLSDRLSEADWLVLAAVCAFHDLGKLRRDWAAQGEVCLERVEWIAHDFDSETILRNNPGILKPLGFSEEQNEAVLALCRLHSLPGQFFFGEGNLSAYRPVAFNPDWLKVARIQGVLDVMSALNHGMVKPILASHIKLKELLDGANQENLLELTARASAEEVPEPFPGLGPVAQQRLQKLTGVRPDAARVKRVCDTVGEATLAAFRSSCEGIQSWYGTYVANALGSGLLRALGENPPVDEVLTALIRLVAAAAACYNGPRQEWALSALQPALEIQSSPAVAHRLLTAANALGEPQQASSLLLAGEHPLRARRGDTGVALELS